MRKATFIILMLLWPMLTLKAQWEWRNPYPFGWNFSDVYFTDTLHGWLCGGGGRVYKTSDGGESWQELNTNISLNLAKIYFLTLQKGYTITDNGNLYQSLDGGSTWTSVDLGGKTVADVEFATLQKGFLCGPGPTLLETVNGGQTWEQVQLPPFYAGYELNDLYFRNETVGYTVGYCGLAYRTTNGGQSWTLLQNLPSLELFSVFFLTSTYGFISGEFGCVGVTSDAGENWDVFMASHTVSHIRFINSTTGFAISEGKLVKTEDGGHTWAEINNAPVSGLCLVKNHLHAAGPIGTILKSTDQGNTVSSYTYSATYNNLYEISFCDSLHGYVVGLDLAPYGPSTSEIIRTQNGGDHWELLTLLPSYTLYGVCFINPLIGFTYGYYNAFLRTNDGGYTWTELNTGINGNISQVYFTDEQTGYVLCRDSTSCIFKSTDAGLTWERFLYNSQIPWTGFPYRIQFIDSLTGFFLTQSSVYRTDDGGQTWIQSLISGEDILTNMHFLDKNLGYCVSSYGKVFKTTDGSSTWIFTSQLSNIGHTQGLQFTSPDTGYIVCDMGKILHTYDGGYTWSVALKGPYLFTDLLFLNNSTGFAIGLDGVIFKYTKTTPTSSEPISYHGHSVKVFPNPAREIIYLSLNAEEFPVKLSIYNTLGTLLTQITLESPERGLNLASYPSGLYYLKIETPRGLSSAAFLKN